ncbi:MAG: zinc ribbon domain-containing protein [Herpetosiphonaceae bacterium]|nr:zinc ribbon domain-containing protein [Herpetosiphonaceae bacterium]
MQCPTCQRDNDPEAIFCVYCGVRIESAPIPSGGRPITGATVDLRRAPAPAPTPQPARPVQSAQQRPAVVPPPSRPTLTWAHQHGGHKQQRHVQHHRHAQQGSWWGWLLLGLGALFLLKDLWWLLFIPVIFGFTALGSYNQHSSRGQQRQGKQALVWILGLGTLIATGWWVPGIFVVWLIASKVH